MEPELVWHGLRRKDGTIPDEQFKRSWFEKHYRNRDDCGSEAAAKARRFHGPGPTAMRAKFAARCAYIQAINKDWTKIPQARVAAAAAGFRAAAAATAPGGYSGGYAVAAGYSGAAAPNAAHARAQWHPPGGYPSPSALPGATTAAAAPSAALIPDGPSAKKPRLQEGGSDSSAVDSTAAAADRAHERRPERKKLEEKKLELEKELLNTKLELLEEEKKAGIAAVEDQLKAEREANSRLEADLTDKDKALTDMRMTREVAARAWTAERAIREAADRVLADERRSREAADRALTAERASREAADRVLADERRSREAADRALTAERASRVDVDQALAAERRRREIADRALERAENCIICFDQPRERVLKPCNHMIACDTCAYELTQCPLCEKYINGRYKAILS